MALYFYWLSPQIFLIVEWPTPTLMLMTFAPVMIFVFPALLMHYFPVRPNVKKLFALTSVAVSLYILFVIKTYEVFAPEKRHFQNAEGKAVCSTRAFAGMKSNPDPDGICSIQFYAPNQGEAGRLALRKTRDSCIESLNKACNDFCGNRAEPGDNHVNSFIINFGPKENFDEVHLPLAATQTLALVICEDYLYRQKQPPSLTETIKSYGGVSP